MKKSKKKIAFITLSVIAAIIIILAGVIMSGKTLKITISDNELDDFYGWGTSACWWSQMVENEETRKDLAKKLFSKDGLGLNIYRYNIGGGVNPEHNRVTNNWRNTESFYYYNEKTKKFEYDFSRDKNAQDFLFESLKYGCIDTVVLFANSPHYSMTITGEASGSNEDNDTTNLSKEHYQDYVDYFLDITEYFIKKGVPVKFISPINEPQWGWGGDGVHQEGCHYEPDQVYELIKLFSEGIKKRKLDVKLSCPESGNIGDTTKGYFDSISGDTELFETVGSLCYHSYGSDTRLFNKIKFGSWLSQEPYNETRIDMSEWCELPCKTSVDNVKSAVTMARVIANDIDCTNANSWSSWVAVNQIGVGDDGLNYSDGLFYAKDDFSEYETAERYYALAHFSKFVPTGSKILEVSANKASYITNLQGLSEENQYLETSFCAFRTPDGKTVLILVNEGDDKEVKLSAPGETMTVYTTDSEVKLKETYSGAKTDSIKLEKDSINTVMFE
ncbi:MAG: glycoside hydrolase [Acutalibacteraceae bacterium]